MLRTRYRGAIVPLCLCLLLGCLERKLAPLSPCLVSNVVDQREFSRIDKVDLLFMVDNSNSMAEEQASLELQFPRLIRALTTGDIDGNGTRDFEPARDLHLGVVSSDLGLPRVAPGVIDHCSGFGDDGILNTHGSKALSDCKPSYPPFLSYLEGVNDPDTTAHDFACVAQLGTGGCGYEQQLEAPLKALWPSVDPAPGIGGVRFLGDGNGMGQLGHGDRENAGFLRDEQHGGLSLLAIVVVSDEDDCSSLDDSDLATLPQENRNLRCLLDKNVLYDTSRYVKAFKALRPEHPDLVLFAAIVGAPKDLVDADARHAVDFGDAAQRGTYYDRLLADPRMTEVPFTDGDGSKALVPSCESAHHGKATPPRRIVEVARDFGESGLVESVCQDDFAPAMQAITDAIAERLGSFCLPRKQVRNSDGKVNCNVVWELPKDPRPGVPNSCAEPDFPFLLPTDPGDQISSKSGGVVCKLAQLRVMDDPSASGKKAPVPTMIGDQMFSDGWYYDDYSQESVERCKRVGPQRLAFTERASPPNGVTARLECLDERQSLPMQRTDTARGVDQPSIGDACDEVVRNGRSLSRDQACAVTLASASMTHPDAIDHSMFCHPQANVCVRACTSDGDCPQAWVCDDRSETLVATRSSERPNGSAFCVNPTCGS